MHRRHVAFIATQAQISLHTSLAFLLGSIGGALRGTPCSRRAQGGRCGASPPSAAAQAVVRAEGQGRVCPVN